MSRLTRTLVRALTVTSVAAAVAAPLPALAAPGPDRIDLETGTRPEGIAAGPGTTFFAGARSDGAVYVGDVRTGTLDLLVEGDGQGPAVGLLYDQRSRLLWVAGGNGGDVTAYDARTGVVVFRAEVDDAGFLNDVAITRDAVYVTDSFSDELTVVRLDRNGRPTGQVSSLRLTGAFPAPAPGAFGPNGIRELPGGDLVVVSEGVLYRVDPVSGVAGVIDVLGRDLTAGDGLELRGNQLYVVNGYGGNEVVVLRLQGDRARTTGVLTAGGLDRPTTGALIGGALYVVNGRFGTLATNPSVDVYVSKLRLR